MDDRNQQNKKQQDNQNKKNDQNKKQQDNQNKKKDNFEF